MPLSNQRRKPRLLEHAMMRGFVFFNPPRSSKKTPDLRDRAPDLAPTIRAHRRIASSVAIGSEKPTTPCKCCGSITGRWWTGRLLRGTGRFCPLTCIAHKPWKRWFARDGEPVEDRVALPLIGCENISEVTVALDGAVGEIRHKDV